MKNLNYLVLALALSVTLLCCSPIKNRSTYSVDRDIVLMDTFFLKRETMKKGQVYHAIYIDSTKNSTKLFPLYGFSELDSANLKDYLQAIRQKNIVLNKFNMFGLTSEWLPVYQLNSKYYLYRPSDTGGKRHGMLTDSLMLYYWMDGYSPIAIKSISKKNDSIFTLKGQHYTSQDERSLTELNIYIVDKKRMLTVWEYKIGDASEFNYQLMTPKEFAGHFSIIVNESIEKQLEVAFDKIDFQRLISSTRN